MPRSKRSKVTTLTKTASRTTKASKLALVQEIHNEMDKYEHIWLFSVGDMRNEGLKEVRAQWRGTGRMFFGKGRVMQKALGLDAGDEHKEGLHKLSDKLTGQMGLFLTSHPVTETLEWFESYTRPEYARQNHIATRDITLPSGPILTPFNDGSEVDADGKPLGDPFPHSMEPQLRQLGLSTSLVRGVPSLNAPHVLCKKGERLTSEKCRVLKLLGVQMSQFRIHLGSRWSKDEGFVEGKDLSADELDAEAGGDDEEMED